ncbi:hypothetical protein [Flavobacterium sp.]|nr:hypothetical protein [Flavobacterium sp.]
MLIKLVNYLLHDKLDIHDENPNTLNWFNNTVQQAKKGIKEWEARYYL